MQKLTLLSLLLFTLITSTYSQNNVTLKINHKLNDDEFVMYQATKNNLDNEFNVTRLQYYISEISIIHDGGIETPIIDYWALIDTEPSSVAELNLGEYEITNAEKVIFHIGVDPDHNHLDPSTYASDHPLAPKSPSMHWGWSGGYRFIAFEGNCGNSLLQEFQLHGLGDDNYFSTEIEVESTASNNQLNINIDADYTRALENINVGGGLIVHGDFGAAKQCIENFVSMVFSPSNISSKVSDLGKLVNFDVIPNVITSGSTFVQLDLSGSDDLYNLTISSSSGNTVQVINNVKNNQTLDLTNQPAGLYFINLMKNGQPIKTKRVILKK